MPTTDPSSWTYLQTFGDAAGRARTFADLRPALSCVVEKFRFSWFALVQDNDAHLRETPRNITNYPEAWQEEIIERKLFIDDPAHAASAASAFGVRWDNIEAMITLRKRQKDTLERARSHGLHAGFTMRLRAPGTPPLVLSLARDKPLGLQAGELLPARLIGAILLEHAPRILMGGQPRRERISLSPRQVECIALVAQGKTDWEIATILGISRNTVHEYIEAVRKRYGVDKRIQVVLRAIQDGHIGYDALM